MTFDVTKRIDVLFPLVNCFWIMKYIGRVELSWLVVHCGYHYILLMMKIPLKEHVLFVSTFSILL